MRMSDGVERERSASRRPSLDSQIVGGVGECGRANGLKDG